MASRLKLQTELEELLGSKNVYFQPPENTKLKYDCILYNRSPYHSRKADDKNYMLIDRYELTLIYRNPDSDLPKQILERFKYCSGDRMFVSDNLYHATFTLYY